MRNVVLLSIATFVIGCAPTTTSSSIGVDRILVGQQWDIEFTLDGQRESGTFLVTQEGVPRACAANCGSLETMTTISVNVRGAESGDITLMKYRDGRSHASFRALRLGRFDDAYCQVPLGSGQSTLKANIKTGGATTYADGSCRVLSAR